MQCKLIEDMGWSGIYLKINMMQWSGNELDIESITVDWNFRTIGDDLWIWENGFVKPQTKVGENLN
jgi:hypothetical protein